MLPCLIAGAAAPYLDATVGHNSSAGACDSIPARPIQTGTDAGTGSHRNIRTDAVICVARNQVTYCIPTTNGLQQGDRQSCHQARRSQRELHDRPAIYDRQESKKNKELSRFASVTKTTQSERLQQAPAGEKAVGQGSAGV
jgi:hypothetical protein